MRRGGSAAARIAVACVLAGVIGTVAPIAKAATTGATAPATIAVGDKAFVKAAIQDDIAGRDAALLAQRRGYSAAVESLGEQLAADYREARDDIIPVAYGLQEVVPGHRTTAAKQQYKMLFGLSGTAFDKAYLQATIAAEEQQISDCALEAKDGGYELAALAENRIPELKQTLMAVQSLLRQDDHATG